MEPQSDFKELLGLFNKHKVEYIIVGAYALAFHGAPRFTGDIDIFVQPSPENSQKIVSALDDFGFGSLGLAAKDFQIPKKVVQLGLPPVRIDIITSITGVSWQEAYRGKQEGRYGNIPVFFLGRESYLENKKALGRQKDLADIEALGEE